MMDAAADGGRDARRAWITGGTLLVAYAVTVFVAGGNPALGVAGVSYVLTALWVAALLVFAFGIRRSGSVVGRHPVGVAALLVAAAEPVVSTVLWAVVPSDGTALEVSVMLGQALQVLSLAALVVAAVVIGRAGAVPARMRWLPLLVVAATAGVQILAQIAAVSAPAGPSAEAVVSLYAAAAALGQVGILALGVLAIVCAPRPAAASGHVVQVYPPAD